MVPRLLAALAVLCCFATPAMAQRLTRVEILALQQQLRDDGCGVDHTTGQLDAMTRRAVEKCKSKYNVTSGGAAALLAAMNLGFTPGEGTSGMMAAVSTDSTTMRGTRRVRSGRRMRSPRGSSDTTMMRDSTRRDMMRRDTTRRDMMPSDTIRRDSAGMRTTNP